MITDDIDASAALEFKRVLEECLIDMETVLPHEAREIDLSQSSCRPYPANSIELKEDVYNIFREAVTSGAGLLCDDSRFGIARWVYRFSSRRARSSTQRVVRTRRPTLSKR